MFVSASGAWAVACVASVLLAQCLSVSAISAQCAKCPKTKAPVCGYDAQTYQNDCVARHCAKTGPARAGPCKDTCQGLFSRQDKNCPAVFDPVCARGITYQHPCGAEVAGYGPDCYYKGICVYAGGKRTEDLIKGVSGPFQQGKNSKKYDYKKALSLNYLFYESMRSGKLVNNRIPWRGDSCFNCKGVFGEDLSGGYYEAGGSYLKMTQVIAYTTAMLGWAVASDPGYKGVRNAGQLGPALQAIKWGTDYLIKGHYNKGPLNKHRMVAQFGHRCRDFVYFGPPEQYEKWVPGLYRKESNKAGRRDVAYVGANDPGSEITSMSAAALIIAAKVFKREPSANKAYIKVLESRATQLYALATTYQGSFENAKNKVIQENHKMLWGSPGYKDDLAFAAAWMYAYTKNAKYLNDARKFYNEVPAEQKIANGYAGYAFDGKTLYPALHVLLAQLDPANQGVYIGKANQFINQYADGGIYRTVGGLAYPFHWGALRVAANTAFLALLHGENPAVDAGSRQKFKEYGLHQINYMLGDSGRSYMMGFGANNPKYMWHKMSAFDKNAPASYLQSKHLMTYAPGPMTQRLCGLKLPHYVSDAYYDFASNSIGHKYTPWGALYGAPLPDERIVFGRDFSYTEPSTDGNAGLTGALALLSQ